MREIKFRGKSLLFGKWIYGDYIDATALTSVGRKTGLSRIGYPIIGGYETISVIAETVGQFTGIKDGNGTEIFEGDIIEVTLRHNNTIVSTYNAIVDQKEGAFGFKNKQGFCPFYGQIHENYKVIGNIHDNPELMKGGEK